MPRRVEALAGRVVLSVSIGAGEVAAARARNVTVVNVGNETHPMFEKCGADLLPSELPVWLLSGHFTTAVLAVPGLMCFKESRLFIPIF